MSGVAAAVSWDGSDCASALNAMVDAGRGRAPDGVTSWTGPGAALARLHRLTLPGQSTSAQPALERGGPHVLVFDGRLDRGSVPDPCDDAELALDAIARFGDRAVEHVDGEFAFAAWRADTRTLIAARDRIGIRPLYWTQHGATLLVASEIGQLLAALPATPPPDVSAVAGLIAFEPAADGRTLYTGIHRVPGGHVLMADARGVRTRCYWRAEPSPQGSARSDDDYADECRALLDRAVRERLRATARPVLFYSGGIDSSSVLATAVRVAPEQAPQPLSLIFESPESREAEYRAALAVVSGVLTEEIPAAPFDAAGYQALAARRRLPPSMPGAFRARSMRARARAMGARVALTGEGGDVVFGGTTFVYADLLRAGRILSAVRRHRLDATYDDGGWTRFGLLTDGVWPLLPQSARRRLRGPVRRMLGRDAESPWLRLPVPERDAVPDPPAGVSMASWVLAWDLNRGWTGVMLDAMEWDASESALELRHPLLDPALVRFALSLPEEQRRRGRVTKYVLRRAAGLPAVLAARTTKGDSGSVVEDALEALGGRAFFAGMEMAGAGWVDAAEACRGYDVLRRRAAYVDPVSAGLVARLWVLAALELWFRAEYGARAGRNTS